MENLNKILDNAEQPEADAKLGKALNTVIKNEIRKDFRESLNAEFGVHKKVKPKFRLYKIIGAIAACSILMFSAMVLLQSDPGYDTILAEQITAAPIKHPGMLKGNNDNPREVAILAYQNEKWELAIRSYAEIDAPTPVDQFYQSLSQFYAGDYAGALDQMNKLPASNYGEEIRWFKALAHLKQSDSDSATALLMEIKKGDYKYEEAQQLLQSLK